MNPLYKSQCPGCNQPWNFQNHCEPCGFYRSARDTDDFWIFKYYGQNISVQWENNYGDVRISIICNDLAELVLEMNSIPFSVSEEEIEQLTKLYLTFS